MIIGTCGFCSTGSSAVSDYLSEFDENKVLDKVEFIIPYIPDGLLDLEYHLTKCICRDDSSALAIPRFRQLMNSKKRYYCVNCKISEKEYDRIISEFLDKLIQFRWVASRRIDNQLYGNSFVKRFWGNSIMEQRVIPYLNKKFHRCVEMFPMHEVELSINPDRFMEAAKEFVSSFLSALGSEKNRNIVIDQPFPGDDPLQCFHFFDNPVAIVVDRDPRDNYIFAKEFLYKRGKFMPTNNVKEFVQYYKLIRHNRPYKREDSRILRMHFEDMVYEYENATARVRNFLQLGKNPRPLSVFDPKLSINNTQLILKFPQYAEDVKYIEECLPEYLFDFSKYPQPDNTGKMFMGKSPLNKH